MIIKKFGGARNVPVSETPSVNSQFLAESEFQNSNVGGKQLENPFWCRYLRSGTSILNTLYVYLVNSYFFKGHK